MKEKKYVDGSKKTSWISSLSILFAGATLSEPLRTFKGNVEAMDYIAQQSLSVIRGDEVQVSKLYKDGIKSKEENEKNLQEGEKILKDLIKAQAMLREKGGSEENKRSVNNAIKAMERVAARDKELVDRCDSINKRWLAVLDKYEKANENLMPMVFVYLVTIWDAFILDTVRRILRVHPQVIVSSKDATIEVRPSFLWDAENIEDIRNYLIEDKVRQLDGNRAELLKCFRDYWGTDWKMSGIELIDVIEIRARRDIWVHNRGIVNRQYLSMVGEHNLLREGQVAKIDMEYFDSCLQKLTELAVYIHKIAHKKHYAETEVI